ncbi:protein phosphatase 2, regulatory subunit A [Rhizopus azygosporus]|uniref:Protein phosphatase 2, regulatory subunit A n=1 Tax=Rhizopus azygosporus TaxID=86630 RepID=A0A367JGZ6_RHIAZ|nr:protein phosphatase 2, regulatory subunit A [Rhizopus azygosporus]
MELDPTAQTNNIEPGTSSLGSSSSNVTNATTLAPENNFGDRPNDEQELYPIAVLVDELKNEDVQLRLNAIRNLSTIAMALGPQRTRDELIPFLCEGIDDEDEVLLAVAEELGNFGEYVGGPEYAHFILAPLENLASVEEVLVRDKAVDSINNIAKLLNAFQVTHYFLPLLKRLSNAEWFTGRISACGLYAVGYSKCTPEQQSELRTSFAALIQDDTPMVRRAAAKALANFSKELTPEVIINNILPLFLRLTTDDQDTVRLLTVEDLVQIAKLCEATSDAITIEEKLALFLNLIKDSEGEVKILAIGQAPGFSKLLEKNVVIEKIIPCFKELVIDTNQHVRSAVATNISGFAPILEKEQTIEYLLPLFLQLLKDDFPEVRLNIISNLEDVNQVIGVDSLSQSLLPAIVELAEDKQWRVRLAIIQYIPLLASQLGIGFFDDKLLDLCLSWLGDTVFSIRDAATTNLKKLVEIFGYDWAKNTILPRVNEMAHNENYLYRMTTLFALTTMAVSLTPEIIKDNVLPTVVELVNDPIPNVRFNVAKSLEVLAPILKQNPQTAEAVSTKINDVLQQLSQDSDVDVKWFAEKAILTVQSC